MTLVRKQHYTKSTVSAARHCKKCSRVTQHRVDGGRIGPCLECIARLESTKSTPSTASTLKQGGLF